MQISVLHAYTQGDDDGDDNDDNDNDNNDNKCFIVFIVVVVVVVVVLWRLRDTTITCSYVRTFFEVVNYLIVTQNYAF